MLRRVLFRDTYNELMATLCAPTPMTFTTAPFPLSALSRNSRPYYRIVSSEALFIVLPLRKSSPRLIREFRIYRAVRGSTVRVYIYTVYISEIWIFAYFRSNSAVGHMGFWHVSIPPLYFLERDSPLRDCAAIKIWRSNSNFKLIPATRRCWPNTRNSRSIRTLR